MTFHGATALPRRPPADPAEQGRRPPARTAARSRAPCSSRLGRSTRTPQGSRSRPLTATSASHDRGSDCAQVIGEPELYAPSRLRDSPCPLNAACPAGRSKPATRCSRTPRSGISASTRLANDEDRHIRLVGQPLTLSRTPRRMVWPPESGKQTNPVLKEFGDEIAGLRDAKAV